MANTSQAAPGDRPEPAAEQTPAPNPPADPGTSPDASPDPPAESPPPAEASWRSPGHTVVETALEVTGYSQATR
ncbi:hypothetical protein ACFYU9_19030 [Streptomyces sp. NPDC004327]|uniref:hypothetical protein n=1 Tax=unclassified Streptomyces TaxID=2593676 RepID=UPI00368DFAF4